MTQQMILLIVQPITYIIAFTVMGVLLEMDRILSA